MRQGFAQTVRDNMNHVLLGKDHVIDHALTALLAGGHLLIEDKPGVGKTLLARALARSIGLPYQRVQCTADLLPTDILGAHVYQPQTGELTFRPGPAFTSVLLADELNRTPPRTQSALLECMAERRVTVDRTTHELPDPFFVLATQNPIAFAGTYPLPENQLDRFLMRIEVGYPEGETEIDIVAQEDGHRAFAALETVVDEASFREARDAVDAVRMDRDLTSYIVALAQRTRSFPDIQLGISPRGAQALHRACRARAVVMQRDYVVPDDVRALIGPVFGHRIKLHGRGGSSDAVMQDILVETTTPD